MILPIRSTWNVSAGVTRLVDWTSPRKVVWFTGPVAMLPPRTPHISGLLLGIEEE